MPREKSLRLRLRDLQSAYVRAETYSAAWRAVDVRWGSDTWQAAALESLMLPGVWDHLKARAAIAGNSWAPRAFDYYAPLERAPIDAERIPQCAGLPGYSLRQWCTGTGAGTAWDGVRRELWGSDAAYHMQSLAFCSLNRPGWRDDEQRNNAADASRLALLSYGIRIV